MSGVIILHCNNTRHTFFLKNMFPCKAACVVSPHKPQLCISSAEDSFTRLNYIQHCLFTLLWFCYLLHGSLENLLLIGQSCHSVVKYFWIMNLQLDYDRLIVLWPLYKLLTTSLLLFVLHMNTNLNTNTYLILSK